MGVSRVPHGRLRVNRVLNFNLIADPSRLTQVLQTGLSKTMGTRVVGVLIRQRSYANMGTKLRLFT